MLTKSMPYFNMNNPEEIFDFVKLGATSPKCRSVMSRLDINQETIDLVLRMLVSDPSTRPSTEQLLNDSYFDSIRNSF
jgi:serine/threonine protein kinase